MFMEILPCPEQEFLNGTSDLRKAGRMWRMIRSQGGLTLPQLMKRFGSDHRITIHIIVNDIGMDKETVRTILIDTLDMRKVCTKYGAKALD